MRRRTFLTAGALGTAGLGLADVLRLQAETKGSGRAARKTSVIFVELAGGPTQFETYDPKPKAPMEYRGELGIIQTNVPGVIFSELMVEQAKIADKLAIIRSVHHRHNSHDPSSHMSQTGYYKTGKKGGPNQFPCFGSVVAKLRGPNSPSLPAYVAVPSIMRNGQAAYLGQEFNPFEMISDPNDPKFKIRNLQLTNGISLERINGRRELLSTLDAQERLEDLDGASKAVDGFARQAFELVHGSKAREAFDIGREPGPIRDRYGRNTVGQSMLLARRLVEAGVTCVTVRCTGWDDHKNMYPGLKGRAPNYDLAIATLVRDLYDRGLDRDVLVVAMGEFGRTPRVNKNAGRDHWGALMSVLMAGGGLNHGIVGASNPKGEVPVDAPYRPANILSMIYRHLGIDPANTINDLTGRPRYLLEEREPVRELV
jgi:hypothetical protein